MSIPRTAYVLSYPEGYDPGRWRRHTAYSDPGRHAELLGSVPNDLSALSATARNVIVHYRASGRQLPDETRGDVNARWLSAILDLDQQRHNGDLVADREPERRVQGCCRDHSLFAAAVLRQHGASARIRYGFAGYFLPDFHPDHVVVETWQPDECRWRRFDPEIEAPRDGIPAPQDMPFGDGAPFRTAAEVWADYRAGWVDAERYGVGPDIGVQGPWFIQGAVVTDAVFRAGHELLLWDGWDALSSPEGPTEDEARLADDLAAEIMAADAGDTAAERRLLERGTDDPAVRPPEVVETLSLGSAPPTMTDLAAGPPAAG